MIRIQDLVGEELSWTQPRVLSSEYDLSRGDEEIGTLRFRTSFGSLATARIDPGCWTFKRQGFLKTTVSIKPCDDERDLGVFRNNTWSGGGTLELPGGRFINASTNFWHSQYEFTADGEPLVKYRTRQVLRLTGQMEILPAARPMPELPWLVMLGWYLAVMMHRDDSAAAAS